MADNRSFGPAETDHRGPIGTVDKHATEDAPVVEETLIEEVSIDGMCGVY
ncbi:mycofactocin precursor MftA [Nocardia sp. NPDC019395]